MIATHMTEILEQPVDIIVSDEDVKKRTNYLNKFKKCFENKQKVALFSHSYVDPDALGSLMAVSWLLLKQFGVESDMFYSGDISHPQNLAMVNLLDPQLKNVSEYVEANYGINILVDTVPINAGVGDKKIKFNIVIDHHKEVCGSDFQGLFINLKAGSCCATVYDIINRLELKFEKDNDQDSKVATALMIGIATDTENLMSDDCTEFEFKAWSDLFEFRDTQIMKQIIRFKRPKFWVDSKTNATMKASIDDGIAVIGMGILPSKHRDMIADMADEMVTWESVNTAIAFAIVDGGRIEGSVRSSNPSLSVSSLCKNLGGKYGNGGGKLSKGAYRYDLGGGGVDEDDDEQTKLKTWELFEEKEKKRIGRVIKL